MEKIKLKIMLDEGAKMPAFAHDTDACMDLFSNMDAVIKPGEREVVKSGVHIELPNDYEIQVRSKSGLAAKKGVCVLNAPGVIDAGYTGDISAIMINLGKEDYIISKGDKVAQIILAPVLKWDFEQVDSIGTSDRGDAGFGSTGIK